MFKMKSVRARGKSRCVAFGSASGVGARELILRLDPQIFHLLIQGVAIDAEEVGGFGFDAAALGQRSVDESLFDLIDHELIDFPFAEFVVNQRLIA
jgi:hypothetical protein